MCFSIDVCVCLCITVKEVRIEYNTKLFVGYYCMA